MSAIELRPVVHEDVDIFYNHQLDVDAGRMAAFTHRDPLDRSAFDAHWEKILADPTVINRTVIFDGVVVGHVGSYLIGKERHVTYWIDRNYWGKGLATEALKALLKIIPDRPLFASSAGDNAGSIRVLEKCGFRYHRSESAYANARDEEIEEKFFRLD